MLLIWLLGLLYSWWTVEDLTAGLAPLGECFTWITAEYAERRERVKAKAEEARRPETARMETERPQAAGVDRQVAWRFFRLRRTARKKVDVEQNTDADADGCR